MQNESNQENFYFYEREKEKLDSLESLGYGVSRWNVEGLRLREAWGLWKIQASSATSPSMRTCKLKNTCKKLVKYSVLPTQETWITY